MIPDLSGLLSHFGSEVVLCLGVPAVILADLFAKRTGRERAAGLTAFAVLLAAFVLAVAQGSSDSVVTKLLRADGLAHAFRMLATGTGVIAAWAALRGGDVPRGRTEFYVCLIGAVVGASLTAAANDMVMLYLAIETLSISGYLLAGFKRNDPKGSEAAMKYVIFGAIASGIMLYGLTLLYGFAGSTVLTPAPGVEGGTLAAAATRASGSPAFLVAIVLVFAGIAYKVAAFPFQFWCPDVYEGAPTSVAAFLAVASKGAGFAALLRVVGAVTAGGAPAAAADSAIALNNEYVQLVLCVMALITMTVGNVAALRQTSAKRILAYSAIAHAGYLLMAVAVTTSAGATAVVFYMMVYLFMTLGAFYMVALVERETGRGDLAAFDGLGFRAPVFAACMTICLIGLTGLPPTSGFVGKFYIFKEVFAYSGNGSRFAGFFFWAGVIGLMNGVISLAYYMRFVRNMYLVDAERREGPALSLAVWDRGSFLLLAAPVLVLGVAFPPLYRFAENLAEGIFRL